MNSKRQWLGLLACVCGVVLWAKPMPASALAFRQVSTTESQGLSNQPILTLQVSPTLGLTISFIPSGELIQQVRVGDPTRIVADFDSPIGSAGFGREQGSGATVIYLRQLGQPLDLNARLTAQARNTNEMPLSVVTIDRQGNRHLHQFLLQLGQTSAYSTVEVVPDLVLAQRRLAATQRAAQSRPRLRPAVPTRTADVATQFEHGLALTELTRLPGLTPQMQERVGQLLVLLQSGESIESAAAATEVPIAIANQILALAADP